MYSSLEFISLLDVFLIHSISLCRGCDAFYFLGLGPATHRTSIMNGISKMLRQQRKIWIIFIFVYVRMDNCARMRFSREKRCYTHTHVRTRAIGNIASNTMHEQINSIYVANVTTYERDWPDCVNRIQLASDKIFIHNGRTMWCWRQTVSKKDTLLSRVLFGLQFASKRWCCVKFKRHNHHL